MKRFVSLCGILVCLCGSAQAQGLLWSLPQDGQWVRYEGTYSQTVTGAEVKGEATSFEWRRIVTLKSVGTETADFQGKSVPGRWLEIKIETGKATAEGLEPGPGGVQLYKLLVPEEAIHGKLFETVVGERQVFVAGVPVIKGARKSGDQETVTIEAGVFQLYPVVALINHYPDQAAEEGTQQVTVPAGTFEAVLEKGELVTETANNRSTNTSEVFRSKEIPFGVVKWTASTVTETKGSTDLRSEFTESITIKEELQAAATGDAAQSELSAN